MIYYFASSLTKRKRHSFMAIKLSFLGGNNYSRIGANTHLYEEIRNGQVNNRFLIDFGALFFNDGSKDLKIMPDIIKYLDYCPTKKERGNPLFKYFRKEKEKLALLEKHTSLDAIFLTHIHEDHIGGLVQLLKAGFLLPPIFASKETLAVLGRLLIEQNVPELPELIPINGQVHLNKGLIITPFQVSHTAVGSFGYHILNKDADGNETGILEMGDYNFSDTLLSEKTPLPDFLKDKVVFAVLLDSTSTSNETISPLSFQTATQNYASCMKNHDGRIISATISRSLENMASILTAAKETGRKVFIDGFMQRLVYDELQKQNKLDLFAGTVFNHDEVSKADIKTFLSATPFNKQVIILSGAFAEGFIHKGNTHQAGLVRLANGSHTGFKVSPSDLILLGQRAIPVEGILEDMQKMAQKLGALNNNKVIQNETASAFSLGNFKMMPLQRTGHATKEETKELVNLILKARTNKEEPLTLLPVHGDEKQLEATKNIGKELGVQTVILMNNESVTLENGSFIKAPDTPAPYYLCIQEEENTGKTNTFFKLFLSEFKKEENGKISFIPKEMLLNKSLEIIENKEKNKLIHFQRLALQKRERC